MSEELIEQLQTDDRFRDLPREELERIADLAHKLKSVDKLNEVELFDSLTMNDLAHVAQKGREIRRERGEMIIRQGDTDRAFYVVLSGQLRVWHRDREGKRKLLNYAEPGDYCGELVFFGLEERTANVDVMDDADLVVFGPEGVSRLLEYPEVEATLRKWGEDRLRRNDTYFEGKQEDEITLVSARKNWLALARMLLFPLAIVLLTLAVLALLPSHTQLRRDVATSITLAIVVGMGLWSVWMWEDWRNDDFIVTSKRVIHIERVLIPPFPVERQEVAIERVQDIEIYKQGIWTLLFGVYTLEVRTMGTGAIRFPYLTEIDHIRGEIFHAREMASQRRFGEEQSRIRDSLYSELGLSIKAVTPLDNGQQPEVTPSPSGLMKVVDYFIPRTRIVEPDRIIWRKHWLLLLVRLVPVLFVLGLSVAALILVLLLPGLSQVQWYVRVPIPALAVLYCVGWYLWRYEAWRNDIYIVTNERIVDIEGTPFHLFKETRTEGPFDVIQNIDYTSPNWFYRVLRIGDVTIDTAAKKEAYTFDSVSRPEAVQQEIFSRWVAYRDRQEKQESERRYNEFARWFRTYHRSVFEREE
jgi:CRP-like cAMP-binding protein